MVKAERIEWCRCLGVSAKSRRRESAPSPTCTGEISPWDTVKFFARGAGAQVSERPARDGLAICVSLQQAVGRSALEQDSPPPHSRNQSATRHQTRCGGDRIAQTDHQPHAATFLRHAPTGVGLRHSDRPRTTGACRCIRHDDLHARTEQTGDNNHQSNRYIAGAMAYFRICARFFP